MLNWALDEVENRLETYGVAAVESKPNMEGKEGASGAKSFRQLDVIYTDFERAAFSFRSHASAVHTMLAAPVPFPYFHVVKLLLVVTLAMVRR